MLEPHELARLGQWRGRRAGYFLWTVFYRHRPSTMTSIVKRRGRGGSFLKDFGQALAIYWVLLLVCPPAPPSPRR